MRSRSLLPPQTRCWEAAEGTTAPESQKAAPHPGGAGRDPLVLLHPYSEVGDAGPALTGSSLQAPPVPGLRGRAAVARISRPGTGKRQSITTGARFTPRTWRAWRRASARLLSTHTSPTTRMVGKVVNLGVAAPPLSSRVPSPEQGPGAACLRGLLSSRDGGGGGGTFLWPTATVRAPWRLLLAAGRRVWTRASGGWCPSVYNTFSSGASSAAPPAALEAPTPAAWARPSWGLPRRLFMRLRM